MHVSEWAGEADKGLKKTDQWWQFDRIKAWRCVVLVVSGVARYTRACRGIVVLICEHVEVIWSRGLILHSGTRHGRTQQRLRCFFCFLIHASSQKGRFWPFLGGKNLKECVLDQIRSVAACDSFKYHLICTITTREKHVRVTNDWLSGYSWQRCVNII